MKVLSFGSWMLLASEPVSIAGCKISGVKAQTYTGSAIKPKPVVTVDGKELTRNVDYKVSYSNNKKIGTATMTVKGIGDYTGSAKKTFKINPKKVKLSSLKAGKKKYLLVHAGLGNYSPKKKLDDYSLKEMVWDRADYDTQYFPDTYVVTGHTPTMLIPENPNPGFIFRKNNHIAMDCGACFQGGRLAAFCLDTEEEFYSSVNKG